MEQQLTQQLAEIPFGDLLTSLGRGVAEAQLALDKMATMVALSMSGKYQVEMNPAGEWVLIAGGHPRAVWRRVAVAAGAWLYTFVLPVRRHHLRDQGVGEHDARGDRTNVERKETDQQTQTWTEGGFLGIGGTQRTRTNTTTVSSQFASRFQYSAEGASVVRTKLVPVPPPTALANLVRELAATGT